MIDFHSMILKAISDYKLILRKALPASQCASKMRELGIKRHHVKEADEIGLYKIGLKIIAELKRYKDIDKDKKTDNFYHGTLEFLQYLEEMFANYLIEGDRVIHTGQKASCSLVASIQLMAMSKGKLTEREVQQVVEYGNAVAMYGSKDQKEMFINAVNEHQKCLISEFSEMVNDVNFIQ